MMSGDLLLSNLLSPMVLAFGLGAVATVLKSDLRLPPGLYTALSTYLLFAIGLKGGVALSEASVAELWL
ncbi:sodium-dependent bicarbonate transport family permease, partial [Staphylococcus aureus]|nr:sodium-dependent bicarbonate transport family permease [Staphylococcus aureus]